MPLLTHNAYGKSAVRLVKVTRAGTRHDIKDLTVDVRFEGHYEAAFVAGENAAVLPTDTMKNTVYALARKHSVEQPEEFALVLAKHLLGAADAATRVTVTISEQPWARAGVGGHPHAHTFTRGTSERRVAVVAMQPDGFVVEAGIEDLHLLKSGGSAFAGFLRDAYTTLPDTSDRIFATVLSARWRYHEQVESLGAMWHAVRRVLVETFAEHDSKSVQHTLYAMGTTVLAECGEVSEIRLAMPNRHHLLVDLSAFGLDNPNEVFVATTEPYGAIEATLRRDADGPLGPHAG